MNQQARLPDSEDTGGTCPRCGAYSNFEIELVFCTAYSPEKVSQNDAKIRMELGSEVRFATFRTESLAIERVLHVICQRCRRATLIVEKFDDYHDRWGITSHWPRSSVAVPEHLPSKIEALFLEAASCLQAGAPRGAAIMTRTTIDAALQDCGATGGPDTKQRISSMTATLPQQLIDMAHELRLGGNDATHEFKHNWAVDDARELLDFLLQLLHHLYEVPQQLKAVQRKTAKRRSKT